MISIIPVSSAVCLSESHNRESLLSLPDPNKSDANTTSSRMAQTPLLQDQYGYPHLERKRVGSIGRHSLLHPSGPQRYDSEKKIQRPDQTRLGQRSGCFDISGWSKYRLEVGWDLCEQ